MELDYDQRISTGAFYTPKMWADFCVERLHRVLPTFEGFTFYDPAAGEGALLDALPAGTDCYASTIESKDVEILRAKGYEAEQFDFLTMNTRFLHPNILAASEEGTLVVLTNPPYFKLPADRYALMKRLYPAHCADSVCMFLLRIVRELHPCILATWSKMDIYQALMLAPFRKEFMPSERLLDAPCMTPSKSWGLKGTFPVVFSIFDGSYWQKEKEIKQLTLFRYDTTRLSTEGEEGGQGVCQQEEGGFAAGNAVCEGCAMGVESVDARANGGGV